MNDEKKAREFIKQIKDLVRYWNILEHHSTFEKLDGLAFSILNMIDGTNIVCDGLDLIDENGDCINKNIMLHELYCEKQ